MQKTYETMYGDLVTPDKFGVTIKEKYKPKVSFSWEEVVQVLVIHRNKQQESREKK